MKYLKTFEGFNIGDFKNIKTSVKIFKNPNDNKNNKISNEIIKYDINNFTIDKNSGAFNIYPDARFMNLYKRYCNLNNLRYDENLMFQCTILKTRDPLDECYNLIDSLSLLPNELQGLSLGYKIYKFLLKRIKFIMSLKSNSDKAKNLWYNLLLDKDVYAGTNDSYNIIIDKYLPDSILFHILDNIKHLNIKYDDELHERISNR